MPSSTTWPRTASPPTSSRWPQGYLCGATLLGLEDPASRMARLAGALQLDDEVLSVDEVLEQIRAVTLEEVAQCASVLGNAPRLSTVVGAVHD